MSKDYREVASMRCIASSVQLDSNLHVDAVAQHIHNFDTKAECEANNGIWQDGGLTELYETAYNNTDAGLFPSDALFPDAGLFPVDAVVNVPGGIYYTSNGKRVRLATSVVSTPSVYILDSDGVERFVATISGLFFSRQQLQKRYLDVAISSDGIHGLGLWADYSAIYLDEFNLSDQVITQTATLVGAIVGYSYGLANAVICRSNVLTFASVQATSGIVFASTTAAKLVINTTLYTIAVLALTAKKQADNLIAFYNGGSIVVAVPTATPQILKSTAAGAWAAWSAVQFSATDGISMMSQVNMDSAATTMALAASTASKTTPNFLITISAVGSVATATAAGTLYPSFANFNMLNGVVSPLGSSGVFDNTTAGHVYGMFNTQHYLNNNPTGTKPIDGAGNTQIGPDLDYNSFTVAMTTANAQFTLKSYKAIISIITGSQSNLPGDGGAMINDFGGGDFDSDIQAGNVFGSTNTAGVFYPPDFRKKEAGSNYGYFTYKLNNGKYVLVSIRETAEPQFTEIASGVISMNCLNSTNTIIDTNKLVPYENVCGYVNSFFTNYTNAGSLGYIKKFNKYSNALDQGQLNIDVATVTVPLSSFGSKVNDFSLYQGTNGAYLGNMIVAPSATLATTYYNAANAGTYVLNPSVPISGSSIFQAGFAQLLSATAVQTPNYYGYVLQNLLSKRYQNAFNLYGQKYLFDGERILSVSLSNGDSGTITGVPQTQAFANGLQFIAASPTTAYFLSGFDNTIYEFNGGRQVSRGQGYSNKPTIVDGVYSVRDNSLVLRTASSILTTRYGIVTENTAPYTPIASYDMQNTDVGIYFVGSLSSVIRSYFPLTGSVIIPLDYQTAYFGMKDNQRTVINKIVAYGRYFDSNPTPWNLSWNWQTQDQQGTDIAMVTPACNTDGYFRFEWNPPHQAVTAGQFRMYSTDSAQKKMILEMVMYYNPEADANLPATNKAS